MNRGKKRQGELLSARLRRSADGLEHLLENWRRDAGHIQRARPGAPYTSLMREAAQIVELYEEAEPATFHRPGGLQVIPSAAWWDGQEFRIVPELEEPTDG